MILSNWRTAVVLIVAAIFLHLVPLRVSGELLDVGHVLGFALLAFIFVRSLRRSPVRLGRFTPPPWAATLALCGTIAFLAELLQVFSSRDADLGDLFRDGSGILGGLLLASAVHGNLAMRTGAVVLGCAILATSLFTPALRLAAMTISHARFPVLAQFGSRLDLMLAEPVNSRVNLVDAPPGWPGGGRVAVVEPAAFGDFVGIELDEVARDWSEFDTFAFDVAAVDGAPRPIHVRVDEFRREDFDERYNAQFTIDSTPRTIRVPLRDIEQGPARGTMNLQRIARIVLFMGEGGRGGFYVDDVRLE